eukprot:SAG22_NODE_192_length_15668_cov_4.492389_5_plen_172_part_00
MGRPGDDPPSLRPPIRARTLLALCWHACVVCHCHRLSSYSQPPRRLSRGSSVARQQPLHVRTLVSRPNSFLVRILFAQRTRVRDPGGLQQELQGLAPGSRCLPRRLVRRGSVLAPVRHLRPRLHQGRPRLRPVQTSAQPAGRYRYIHKSSTAVLVRSPRRALVYSRSTVLL